MVYNIRSKADLRRCVNIHGEDITSLTNHQNVTLWMSTNSPEQHWSADPTMGSGMIKSSVDQSFALNYDGPSAGNCDVMPIAASGVSVSVVFERVTPYPYYKIRLLNSTPIKYLTIYNTTNGANIYWTSIDYGEKQLWLFENINYQYGHQVNDSYDMSLLDELDLLARCIYAEAGSDIDESRRGVAYVIFNRMNYPTTVFGGHTYKDVILKPKQFAIRDDDGKCPRRTEAGWGNSLKLAIDMYYNRSGVVNPVQDCKWFFTTKYYNENMRIVGDVEEVFIGHQYCVVTLKIILGTHTYFNIEGF